MEKKIIKIIIICRCDSIVDPTDATMFFTRDFDANTSLYRPGTVQFISMQSYTALDGMNDKMTN